MIANPIRLEELFDKYVRGNITSEEFAEFWHLMKEMQASGTLSAKLSRLWCEWETNPHPYQGPDKSKVFNRILEMGREREINFEKFHPYSITRRLRLPAAAAIVLAALTGLWFLYTYKTKPAITPILLAANTQNLSYIRNIVLPDGSTVILHAGSTLDYPSAFPAGVREVTLKGEAFDVRHDDKKPFIIHTGKVSTTVLGTAFNIRSDSNKVTVSVTGGKVRVEDGKKWVAELVPNQQIIYKLSENAAEKRTVNAEQLVTNWTKQDMDFDGDSFGSIADVVAKRYGVTIRFKNPELANCLIVASFSGTESLEHVLETLCTIRNASYTRKQESQEIEIDGKSCE